MGLDILFNKDKAVKAGLILTYEQNGTEEEIKYAMENDDRSYASWLCKSSLVLQVPYADHKVITEETNIGNLIVRANKWGQTYAPLTRFLEENDIAWDEY